MRQLIVLRRQVTANKVTVSTASTPSFSYNFEFLFDAEGKVSHSTEYKLNFNIRQYKQQNMKSRYNNKHLQYKGDGTDTKKQSMNFKSCKVKTLTNTYQKLGDLFKYFPFNLQKSMIKKSN